MRISVSWIYMTFFCQWKKKNVSSKNHVSPNCADSVSLWIEKICLHLILIYLKHCQQLKIFMDVHGFHSEAIIYEIPKTVPKSQMSMHEFYLFYMFWQNWFPICFQWGHHHIRWEYFICLTSKNSPQHGYCLGNLWTTSYIQNKALRVWTQFVCTTWVCSDSGCPGVGWVKEGINTSQHCEGGSKKRWKIRGRLNRWEKKTHCQIV